MQSTTSAKIRLYKIDIFSKDSAMLNENAKARKEIYSTFGVQFAALPLVKLVFRSARAVLNVVAL